MWNKLKRAWRSYTFKETRLTKGSIFYGAASRYMLDESTFAQGTPEWKNSTYSFKLVVDRIESNKVFYYSYYVDPEGVENISKHVRYVATSALLSDVNHLKLWVE